MKIISKTVKLPALSQGQITEMKNRKEITDELKQVGASWSDSDPCTMPYSIPNTLPETYFNELPSQVLTAVSALNKVEELIAGESNKDSILSVPPQQTAANKPFGGIVRSIHSLGKRSLIAACVAGLLFMALITVWFGKDAVRSDSAQMNIPSSIPDTEILHYLENTNTNYSIDLSGELSFNPSLSNESTAFLFQDCTDEELNAYAHQNGTAIN